MRKLAHELTYNGQAPNTEPKTELVWFIRLQPSFSLTFDDIHYHYSSRWQNGVNSICLLLGNQYQVRMQGKSYSLNIS